MEFRSISGQVINAADRAKIRIRANIELDHPTTIPATANPLCDSVLVDLSLPSAICPTIAPTKEKRPKVKGMQMTDIAREEIASPLFLCDASSNIRLKLFLLNLEQ